ncbi:hypothetical protein [Spirochaeta isovalerica]|uniref:TolB-like protein n=1 Tax=Spirochaeta isovalerica TaxID=150 RepID=A0A841RAR1_9SPIO|nr:hypothetical protein [Spirochaeta isovalerica]MBB6482474.1 TolB-like protein [Spirochaeta isovalerica]
MKRLFPILFLLLALPGSVFSQNVSSGVKTAFLDFENINMDPALDYLGGIIKGLLLYDLSRNEYIRLVNRTEIEEVVEEQNLRLSGLTENKGDIVEFGKILDAQWLVKGEYIYLGRDVLITIKVIDAATAEEYVLSERGASENTVHMLAEKLVMKLTGMEMNFVNEDSVRSIISMKDESPGRVKLYSWVPGAEIYLDDRFIGYTEEDNKTPYIIERIEPGEHEIRTHYWPFGEVDIPEMRFHDWDETFSIKSGEEVVIRANQRQFNSIIYDLQQLIRENYRYPNGTTGPYRKTHSAEWQDMSGTDHKIEYAIDADLTESLFKCRIEMIYDGETYIWEEDSDADGDMDLKEEIGDVEIRLSWSRGRIDYSVWRIDIEQGMWQNQ